jgi:diguanylate cyclase (GGDEF)-like protein
MLDNASLLIGIAFSSASLMVALLIGWMNARQQSYLVHGAAGIGLVVLALLIMGLRDGRYDLLVQLIPFSALLAGFSLIYAGSRLFRDPHASLRPALLVGFAAIILTAIPLIAGYSGIGTIALNLGGAVIMFLCGTEYWRGRRDMKVPMVANATLYTLVSLSFLACSAVLVWEQSWVLTGPPSNWAEDTNSILSLVGLTGIGAITLTLHHARAARRHRDEANTDSLTGVLNRRALFSIFGENDYVTGLAVLMFDLDHFKQINDRLGHAQGDLVLQQFAGVLRAQTRDNDIIARVGGEEFCVILPGLDGDSARLSAERIRLAFAELEIAIGDNSEIATVSAGLAIGGVEETFSSVLRHADDALYKAKSAGRNQVHLAALRLVA